MDHQLLREGDFNFKASFRTHPPEPGLQLPSRRPLHQEAHVQDAKLEQDVNNTRVISVGATIKKQSCQFCKHDENAAMKI